MADFFFFYLFFSNDFYIAEVELNNLVFSNDFLFQFDVFICCRCLWLMLASKRH